MHDRYTDHNPSVRRLLDRCDALKGRSQQVQACATALTQHVMQLLRAPRPPRPAWRSPSPQEQDDEGAA